MTLRSSAAARHVPGVRPVAPTVLEIDLSRGLVDGTPGDPLSGLRTRHTPRIGDVLGGLRRAVGDDSVAAVLLLLGGPVTAARADELGLALEAVSAAGKLTVAFAESFGEGGAGTVSYGLAAHCDVVWMQPSGSVGLTGVAVTVTLLRGSLDKIGAEPQFGQRHEFKTAANTFAAEDVTAPQREMTQRLADSVLEEVTETVTRRRRLDATRVAGAVQAAPLSAAQALEHGLVDRLGYRDEVYAAVRRQVGTDGQVRLRFAHRYAQRSSGRVERLRRHRDPVVAVVEVHGQIVSGRSRAGGLGGPAAGSDSVVAALRAAQDDQHVKAVVLHVDSPGGSYVASDAIRHAVITNQQSGRPVVASMASVAASGGYFVSMAADRVVALPTTLTGSIGVLAGKLVLRRSFERIGLLREAMAAGPDATMFSTLEPFTDTQWAKLDAWLDEVYADFTAKAAADRSMPYAELEPLARGRVWTGADALRRGLVDELGGRQRAVQLACDLAALDRDRVRLVKTPRMSRLERLRPAESTQSAAAAAVPLPLNAEALLGSLTGALGMPHGPLALPWTLSIH